jgi:hypothetical protein
MRRTIMALGLIAGISSVEAPLVHAQGSAGTGSTSTGIGPRTGPAGPGRRGDLTQQPGIATNPNTGGSNLSPAQKNSIPPQNAPSNANRTLR